ncbi:hypothetical protein M0R04_04615 [Candidatus Dojkabacteria bacterium]|jgi:hypothetical protein|nr:hypothetical protein [Candidatus Dojkabacteria bacterium]
MNVKVTYDEETTDLMEDWKSLRKIYIKKLIGFIKENGYTSYSKQMIEDDPGLKELDKQIKKLDKLSIPVRIEIIDEDSYEF